METTPHSQTEQDHHYDRTAQAAPKPNRLSTGVGEIFSPAGAGGPSPRGKLRKARQLIAWLGVFATVIQVVVWLMIGIIGGDLDVPWWLWTVAFTGLAVGALTAAHRMTPESSTAAAGSGSSS